MSPQLQQGTITHNRPPLGGLVLSEVDTKTAPTLPVSFFFFPYDVCFAGWTESYSQITLTTFSKCMSRRGKSASSKMSLFFMGFFIFFVFIFDNTILEVEQSQRTEMYFFCVFFSFQKVTKAQRRL